MRVSSILPISLNDYPGMISAVFFLSGCNWRCGYCHNKMLWENQESVDYQSFLKEKRGKVDAIVICGGEPTIHNWLPELIAEIKSYGYAVKLDTNGSNPEMLEGLEVDFIAMDIKSTLSMYAVIAEVPVCLRDIKRSIEIVKRYPHEFRHTDVGLSVSDLVEMQEIVGEPIKVQARTE